MELQHLAPNTLIKSLGTFSSVALASARLLAAEPTVPAPAAGFDFTPQTDFAKGGVLMMSIPTQPGFANSRDFLPIVGKVAGDSAQMVGASLNVIADYPNPIGTLPPIPVDIAPITNNLVLNLHYYSSSNSVAASPVQGEQVITVPLSNATFTALSPVTNRFGVTYPNVYNISFNLPSGPSVTNGQQYFLGINASVLDDSGQPTVTNLSVRVLPSSVTNDGSFCTLFASKRSSTAPAVLQTLLSAVQETVTNQNYWVTNVAFGVTFKKSEVELPTELSIAPSGDNVVVRLTQFSGPVDRIKLYAAPSVDGPYTVLIPGNGPEWTIPRSGVAGSPLPAGESFFFRAAKE